MLVVQRLDGQHPGDPAERRIMQDIVDAGSRAYGLLQKIHHGDQLDGPLTLSVLGLGLSAVVTRLQARGLVDLAERIDAANQQAIDAAKLVDAGTDRDAAADRLDVALATIVSIGAALEKNDLPRTATADDIAGVRSMFSDFDNSVDGWRVVVAELGRLGYPVDADATPREIAGLCRRAVNARLTFATATATSTTSSIGGKPERMSPKKQSKQDVVTAGVAKWADEHPEPGDQPPDSVEFAKLVSERFKRKITDKDVRVNGAYNSLKNRRNAEGK